MESRSLIKTRYNETDQMGIIYHGNYFNWFDIGRMDFLEKIGIDYKSLEERQILIPIIDVYCQYLKPVKYPYEINIVTRLEKLKGIRVFFSYEIYHKEELLAKGKTTNSFIDEKLEPINMRRKHPDLWEKLEKSLAL